MDGWMEGVESCAVTLRFLLYHMIGGKVIIDRLNISKLR